MKYATLAIDLGYPKALSPVPLMFGRAAIREQRYTVAADYLVQDPRVRSLGAEHAVWLGALDHAYEAAHRTLDEIARPGPVWIHPGSLWGPHMKAFRQDSRFHALVTRLGLMRYWEEYGPPDGCELRGGRLIFR